MDTDTMQEYARRIHTLREELFAENTAGLSAEAEQFVGLAMADLSTAYHHLLLASYRQMKKE